MQTRHGTINAFKLAILTAIFVFAVLISGTRTFASDTICVTDFGADGTDMESDRDAFWNALREASCMDGETEVYVPDGTYYIDDFIGIYSNTWLHLSDGAKIARMEGCKGKSMLIGVHAREDGGICYWDCTHTGYGQCENVTVSGGTWDGGVTQDTAGQGEPSMEVMSFRHADGIYIQDTEIYGTDGYHMLNFDGVQNILIENVYFHDHMWNDDGGSLSEEDMKCHEAVHTDIIANDHRWSNAYPIEDLACRCIVVQDCTFENCVSGVGTHNKSDGLYTESAYIKNCSFKNILFHCVNAINFKDFSLTDCIAENVSSLIAAHGCKGDNLISGNVVSCFPHIQKESCIDMCRGTEAVVKNNVIQNAGVHAICGANFGNNADGACRVTITDNQIENPGNSGIYVRDGCCASVQQNSVILTNTSTFDRTIGIYINKAEEKCKVAGNTVTGFEYGIEAANSADVEIGGNDVKESSKYGVSLYKTAAASVQKCSIAKCGVAIQIDETSAKLKGNSLEENRKDVQSVNGSKVVNEDAPKPTATPRPTATPKPTEAPKAVQKKQAVKNQTVVKTVPVYRMFNPWTGEHLFTTSKAETQFVKNTLRWNYEGVAWYAPVTSRTPVYRLYNPNGGEHHYTCSVVERDWLKRLGWRYEGIGWYSDDQKHCPIYRHYHPRQRTGNHHYTSSKSESDYIVKYGGWRYEGIGWYAAKQ